MDIRPYRQIFVYGQFRCVILVCDIQLIRIRNGCEFNGSDVINVRMIMAASSFVDRCEMNINSVNRQSNECISLATLCKHIASLFFFVAHIFVSKLRFTYISSFTVHFYSGLFCEVRLIKNLFCSRVVLSVYLLKGWPANQHALHEQLMAWLHVFFADALKTNKMSTFNQNERKKNCDYLIVTCYY